MLKIDIIDGKEYEDGQGSLICGSGPFHSTDAQDILPGKSNG